MDNLLRNSLIFHSYLSLKHTSLETTDVCLIFCNKNYVFIYF